MKKIQAIATREFVTTVATKGFIIGALMMPLMMLIGFTLIPKLMNQKQPQVQGTIAIIDPTGAIAPRFQQQLEPRALALRQQANSRERANQVADAKGGAVPTPTEDDIDMLMSQVPLLTVQTTAASADSKQAVADQLEWLKVKVEDKPHLAVVVVDANVLGAVQNTESKLGSYEFYVSPKLNDQTQGTIQTAMREAILSARLQSANIDKQQVDLLTNIPRPTAQLVTNNSDGTTNAAFNRAVPFILIVFLIMGVMMGAGSLLSTTVEEKFSRVLEVLLSAVSPFELMTGKILGQLAVSGLVLSVYVGLGMLGLSTFAMMGLVRTELLVYLVIFFVLNYLFIGAIMGVIGAAVNDLRDAQSLMMPINIFVMIPWLLAAPILRNPDSALSIVMSLMPPVSCFGMLLRLASTSPPPFWQIALSIALNIVAVLAALWFASKIFKISLLLQGKPPSLMTLIKWARAA
jgi:ABC-2 type transport system permease protein